MAYVFLSHSNKDKPFTRRLASDLRKSGHSVWFDEAEINIGDSLVAKISDGLREVDFVAAILSTASIESAWVQKELEIASNREIREKKVVVLPIIIADVELPQFLQGKLYADFRNDEKYTSEFEKLLRALGQADVPPSPSSSEIELLRAELELVRERASRESKEARRAKDAAYRGKSEKLKAAIRQANEKFPTHAPINNTYAFELAGTIVTLDYALWALSKSLREGAHILEAFLTMEDGWTDIENMLSAYADMTEERKS
jgi:hypothetical protein